MLDLFREEDAVSPVIGVVLLVAVTVVLAATVATFALGFGDRINVTAPQAGFSTKYVANADTGDSDSWDNSFGSDHDSDATSETARLDIGFTRGRGIAASALTVRFPGGSEAFADASDPDTPYGEDSQVGTGEEVTLAVAPGDTVRVVWTSTDGGRSATLTTERLPG